MTEMNESTQKAYNFLNTDEMRPIVGECIVEAEEQDEDETDYVADELIPSLENAGLYNDEVDTRQIAEQFLADMSV